MFRIIAPLISNATICTASPTDLSSVVKVVVKPISRIMIVEKELMTPFGIALLTFAPNQLEVRIDEA